MGFTTGKFTDLSSKQISRRRHSDVRRFVSKGLWVVPAALFVFLNLSFSAYAEVDLATKQRCFGGDTGACDEILSGLNKDESVDQFRAFFNEMCSSSKSFKCLKRIVRGDPKEEVRDMMAQDPKRHTQILSSDHETVIYAYKFDGPNGGASKTRGKARVEKGATSKSGKSSKSAIKPHDTEEPPKPKDGKSEPKIENPDDFVPPAPIIPNTDGDPAAPPEGEK
jgi:hypothetical protein